MLGSCAAVRCSPGMHSTCQAAGQLSQHTRLPPLWHLATRRCCPHWHRLQERAICPHQRSLFSLLLQKFEKSSRKWRFLEESCPLPARHKPRSSRTFWPKKHPGDLTFFWLPRKNIVETPKKTDYIRKNFIKSTSSYGTVLIAHSIVLFYRADRQRRPESSKQKVTRRSNYSP